MSGPKPERKGPLRHIRSCGDSGHAGHMLGTAARDPNANYGHIRWPVAMKDNRDVCLARVPAGQCSAGLTHFTCLCDGASALVGGAKRRACLWLCGIHARSGVRSRRHHLDQGRLLRCGGAGRSVGAFRNLHAAPPPPRLGDSRSGFDNLLIAVHVPDYGPSRHFVCAQQSSRLQVKADIKWQAGSAGSVENDP